MSKLMMVFVMCALGGLAVWMHFDYEDAMAKCQVLHSFDTCFHSMNR
jgi:hypothetical protein